MILEEDIAEVDEDIVIDWYLDYSFYIMKIKSVENEFLMWYYSDNFISAPSYKPPRISPLG